ncbi:MAG: hypothetical protein ABSF97_05980 [Candidatus Sulfotelmatobacter sp.]
MIKKSGLQISLFVFLLIILATPSYAMAYGDPSGGFLLQALTPLAAVLWGAWMIFAGNIRKSFRKAIHRIRGTEPEAAVQEGIVSNDELNSESPN